jgi:fimbrial chaperone protein
MRFAIMIGLLLGALGGTVMAGSFQVVPFYIYLDGNDSRATLRVKNTGEEDITVQLMVTSWNQDSEGRPELEPSDDLVFFPRILKVEAGQERTVRIGLDTDPPTDVEKTYRLFIRELPVAPSGEMMLRVAVQISIPVFVSPKDPTPKPEIVGLELRQGELLLRVHNAGNAHVLVKTIRIIGYDGENAEVFTKEEPGWYVLPSIARTFSIPLDPQPCRQCRRFDLVLQTEQNVLQQSIAIDPAQCIQPAQEQTERSADGE